MSDDESKFTASRGARFLSLGKLTSTVGASYLGHTLKSTFQNNQSRTNSLIETNTKNALRIARTFGVLKGAVMKVGQMMSLQEEFLPKEMREILRSLQNQAPPVPFDKIRPILVNELGDTFTDSFSEISPKAYASASIGQVHRGVLRDGRNVVLKIQYPDVDKMVESDLKNLRVLVRSMGQITPIKADLDQFFIEAKKRLTEELDYELELQNILEFQNLFADDPRYIIPSPITELSTKHVLTLEFRPGFSADEICSEKFSQQQRNRFATDLLDVVLTQFFQHHILQADPNLANFAFTQDGRIILYDFGCIKRFPAAFIDGIRKLIGDALSGRYDLLRDDLESIGYVDKGDKKLADSVYKAYADNVFSEWRQPGLFDFGTTDLHYRIVALHRKHWQKALDYDAPADAVYMHRTLGGVYGNLRKLKAQISMYEMTMKHLGTT